MLKQQFYDKPRSKRLASLLGTARSRAAASYVNSSNPNYKTLIVPGGELAAETIKKLIFLEDIGQVSATSPTIVDVVVEIDAKSIFQSETEMNNNISTFKEVVQDLIIQGMKSRRQAELDYLSGISTPSNRYFKQILFVPGLTGYKDISIGEVALRSPAGGSTGILSSAARVAVPVDVENQVLSVVDLAQSVAAQRSQRTGVSSSLTNSKYHTLFASNASDSYGGVSYQRFNDSAKLFSARRFVKPAEISGTDIRMLKDVTISTFGVSFSIPRVHSINGGIYAPQAGTSVRIPKLSVQGEGGVLIRVTFKFLWNYDKSVLLSPVNYADDTDAAVAATSNLNALARIESAGVFAAQMGTANPVIKLNCGTVFALSGARTYKKMFSAQSDSLNSYYGTAVPFPTLDYYENAAVIAAQYDAVQTYDLGFPFPFILEDRANSDYYVASKKDSNQWERIYATQGIPQGNTVRAQFYMNQFKDYSVIIQSPVVYPM